jgi:hypothetical protein
MINHNRGKKGDEANQSPWQQRADTSYFDARPFVISNSRPTGALACTVTWATSRGVILMDILPLGTVD